MKTSIRIRILNKKGLKAFVDVTFDDFLTIRGFRIIHQEGKDPWVGFPQLTYQQGENTKYKDILDVSDNTRREIEDKVLEEYKKLLEDK